MARFLLGRYATLFTSTHGGAAPNPGSGNNAGTGDLSNSEAIWDNPAGGPATSDITKRFTHALNSTRVKPEWIDHYGYNITGEGAGFRHAIIDANNIDITWFAVPDGQRCQGQFIVKVLHSTQYVNELPAGAINP